MTPPTEAPDAVSGEVEGLVERAKAALVRLANTPMHLSLQEWGELSGPILNALQSSRHR